MKSIPKTLLFTLALTVLSSSGYAATAEQIQQQNQHTLQQERITQKHVVEWSQQREDLVNALLDQTTQLEWNRFQNKKFKQYVGHKKKNIVELQRQKQQMNLLRQELEPFLDHRLSELHQSVKDDLPFLPQERQQRLAFLDQSLTDPDLSLSEKLRRVLEALQIEADYGNSVEVTEETLPLATGDTMVQVLRLGRIGLFYLSYDGHHGAQWQPQQQQWLALEDNYLTTLQSTIDIIKQKRSAELVDLPLPLISKKQEI